VVRPSVVGESRCINRLAWPTGKMAAKRYQGVVSRSAHLRGRGNLATDRKGKPDNLRAMGFRLYRRLRIAPGLTLNPSKRGSSDLGRRLRRACHGRHRWHRDSKPAGTGISDAAPLLRETIECDPFPLSPRVRRLRGILVKMGRPLGAGDAADVPRYHCIRRAGASAARRKKHCKRSPNLLDFRGQAVASLGWWKFEGGVIS
jgi:hypothetical protein